MVALPLRLCIFLALFGLRPPNSAAQLLQEYQRITGKRAIARLSDGVGQLRGTVEFSQCSEYRVQVKVDLEDSITGGNCLLGGYAPSCWYQINAESMDDTAHDCPATSDVFDPTSSMEPGWSPAGRHAIDKCSSTRLPSFGPNSKIELCPVGALSRKWGILRRYFDPHLAVFNDIIGRTLMVYWVGADGRPGVEFSCALIEHLSDC